MILRTIDPEAILAAFTPGDRPDPLEAHEERRRLLRAGLWVGARPKALAARTAAELGACVATLVICAGRQDVLPGIEGQVPGLRPIAASLQSVMELDDADMARWWYNVVDAADENMIGNPSVEVMSTGTVIGMRSIAGVLASRVLAATELASAR